MKMFRYLLALVFASALVTAAYAGDGCCPSSKKDCEKKEEKKEEKKS